MKAKGLAKVVHYNKVSLYFIKFFFTYLYILLLLGLKKLFVIKRTLDGQGLLFKGSTVLLKQRI